MNKSYRIHTNISSDTVLNVNMKQDFDFLEVLTLKLAQKDAYKIHSSNYGVIVGRVLANDAFGIPNAKISVFIEKDGTDTTEIENIYPYTQVTTKDRNSIRYNLLPDYSDDDCYRVVGTFPNKRLLLDDNNYLEVYEKYWKYTTVTNSAGDYMIFGVPTGSQQLHTDIDLSDIGILSQKPRDLIYKGYNITEFDNANQFKESTNLDSLKQIISQDKSVLVYPFWGDAENGIAAITRSDIQVDYKFEPTCIFMGAIVSDNEGNSIGHKCAPAIDNGMNNQLVAGEGTIEMIRKTVDGLVEEYQIQGNRLIDNDGVWCYQIPMNLDYVGTDEYGNIVPTDNPNKGIPTRTQVRFRISKTETGDEGTSRHTAKYLVPMNPPLDESKVHPYSALNGKDFEKLYNFGSNTPDSCFRDLYWNNVYSVKNYIPKVQVAHRPYSDNYSALKGGNLVDDQNPIPFNKLRIDISFIYMIICILLDIVIAIIAATNFMICILNNTVIKALNVINEIKTFPFGSLFDFPKIPYIPCIELTLGLTEGNVIYFPGCTCSAGKDAASCHDDVPNCSKSDNIQDLRDNVQRYLAQEFKIVKLDLYQDWINGCLYMPLWFWRKRKKKTFLFGLFSLGAKNEFCDCDKRYSRLKTYVTCDVSYKDTSLTVKDIMDSENKWHKKQTGQVRYEHGVIKRIENKDGLEVYYYTAMQPTDDNGEYIPITEREKFKVVRLYATDIILLGNINENNLYGIPQFFKVVPSTTSNVPPIASIEETLSDSENDNIPNDDIEGEDSGTTIITGMDWGHGGYKETPTFKSGLLMDLGCTTAGTKLKSCINVERLSELGVNLDMTFDMSYSNGGNGIQRGTLDSDGFITKYELDDMDNRSMFATLNHIGFVPQTYQDSVGGYTTQIEDDNTNYLVPKFKYIFPTDFDGRMGEVMKLYQKDFEQAMFDEQDESYITFRLGAEKEERYGRKRHFYKHNEDGYDGYHMPLYNNSFYFYFGINKGNTAIDKFNNLFLAECVKNTKEPFSLDVETHGKVYCNCAYDENSKSNTYATIRVILDGIQVPYTYTLYDSIGEVVIGEKNMIVTTFTIGDITDEGKVKYQIASDNDGDTGTPLVHEAVDNDYGVNGLTNQVYNLVVMDASGKKNSRKIKLETPSLQFTYEAYKLGTRFYNTETSSKEYICNQDTDFYGRIILKEFSVDGNSCSLDGAKLLTEDENGYNVEIGLTNSRGFNSSGCSSSSSVYLTISTLDSSEIKDCICETNDKKPRIIFVTSDTENYLQIDIYQPKRYVISMYQTCNGKIVRDNTYSEIINIPNGENFNTYLNDMPIRFMLGTNNDDISGSISNTSKFYKTEIVTSTTDSNICGWYGVHQEDSYQFGRADTITIEKNQEVWEDFINFGTSSIKNPEIKLSIINYKFRKMFSLSDAVYRSGNFQFHAVGGTQPTLYRSVTPMYDDPQNAREKYSLDDMNTVTVLDTQPNIVGDNFYIENVHDPNYVGNTHQPFFNQFYDGWDNNCRFQGNYFAAFTNNGGYINNKKIGAEESMSVMRSPNYASVSPYNNSRPKEIGKSQEGFMHGDDFKLVKNSGEQQLNDDIKRKTNPYLRALNVDRRLDYDLTIIGPVVGNTFSLYSTANKDRVWQRARIMGTVYGGIEMSYDSDYNIISAKTNTDNESGVLESVEPNKRLEYSYQLSSLDEDSKTIYNKGDANSVWESDTYDIYETDESGNTILKKSGDANNQIVKRFYEASLGEADIRDFFWSNFNKSRLLRYINSTQGGSGYDRLIDLSTPYVFKYPSTNVNLFNGDFNRDDVIRPYNYPTRRYIDICNIFSSGSYNFRISSCSYANLRSTISEDYTIIANTTEGDSLDLSLNFNKPIEFVDVSNETGNFANVVYQKSSTSSNEYTKFSTNTVRLLFRILSNSNNDFNVYAGMPSLIYVLPYTQNVDGITYFKTATSNGEICAAKSIDDAINDVTIYHWQGDVRSVPWVDNDIVARDGINHGDGLTDNCGRSIPGRFLIDTNNDDKYVTCDSTEFANTMYAKEIENIGNRKVLSIVIPKYYISNNLNGLINRIKTIEISELIDCRDILLVFNKENSYVEKKSIATSLITTNSEYSQTVGFDMLINVTSSNIGDINNQAFTNYGSMTFTFMFGEYYATCNKVEAETETNTETNAIKTIKLALIAKCPQEMGILGNGDTTWNCSLIAKSSSNFSYRINFKLAVSNQALPSDNTPEKTNASIS